MRTIIAAVVIGLLAGGGVRGEGARFMTATSDVMVEGIISTTRDARVPSSIKFEVGDTLPWVRFVSASELKGGAADPSDKTYSLLKLDGFLVVVRTEAFSDWPRGDEAKAAVEYSKLVKQSRKAMSQSEKEASENDSLAYRPTDNMVSYAITVSRDIEYDDGFKFKRGDQLNSARWSKAGDSFTVEGRSIPAVYARPVLSHMASADPNIEAYIQRRDQAIERGADSSEIAAIDSSEQLRQVIQELRQISTQQIIFSNRGVIQY